MFQISPVDPHDEAAFTAWYRVFRSGVTAGRTAPLVSAYEELAASLRNPGAARQRLPYAAHEDSTMVGVLLLEFPLTENLRVAEWTIAVPPEHRRRGIGTALYEYGYRIAAARGRTVQFAEIDVPSDLDLAGCAGSAFAMKLGFASQHCEDRLVLELPVPADRLSALRAAAAPAHTDYDFVSWTGSCPDEYLDGYVRMRNQMERDVPTGELDHEPIDWTAERVRDSEKRNDEQGFQRIITVARHTGGDFAGYSLMFVPGHNPEDVIQDDTLVMTNHRGHRIGTELKARNLDLLASGFADRRFVHTWTAESNDAMQRINAAFGFRSAELTHMFERSDAEPVEVDPPA